MTDGDIIFIFLWCFIGLLFLIGIIANIVIYMRKHPNFFKDLKENIYKLFKYK